MKEIKFKAWDYKHKKMFTVHELHRHRISGEINWIRGYGDSDKDGVDVYGGGNMLYDKKPRYILMQYTGLKDKNKVEIYELSDLVKYRNNIGIIVWRGYRYYFKNDDGYCSDTLIGDDLEVIGNTYEHPELITAK